LPNTGHFYIDMELCAFTLRHFVESGGAVLLSAEKSGSERVAYTYEILKNVAAGISHIHRQDLVHRDIKPENSISPFL